jgi:RND family efflux transporter MFP subunit
MIQKLFRWYGKRTVLIVTGLIVGLGIAGVYQVFGTTNEDENTTDAVVRSVTVAPIGSLSSSAARTFVGTVAAVSQADVSAESGGRVVSVPVTIGDRVAAGAVLAQLENAAQRAAVTQAQGAYESALAGAAQGESGVRSAETAIETARNNVVSVVRGAYTTNNNTLLTQVDVFYGNPRTTLPGVRISGRGETQYLNNERVYWQNAMPAWQAQVTVANVNSDMNQLLDDAEANSKRMLALVDTFIMLTRDQSRDSTLAGLPIENYTSGLITERTVLTNALSSIASARSGLVNAEESLARAQISSAGGAVSLADAQVKQALGALQGAQAQLNKTIVRSPISGTVNTLSVAVGDFIGAGTPVAQVVNQSAYEIAVYMTESERAEVSVGDPVLVNGSLDGTVTAIAPAIDPLTQKIKVNIAIESTDVLAGTTVTVSLISSSVAVDSPAKLSVPLAAIAFSQSDGAVLVVEDGKVAALPVTLGAINGSNVEVSGDITADTVIITDARSLIVGTPVVISN